MPKPLRLELDLGFREPRRCLIKIGNSVLVLVEPSFQKIELINSISGLFTDYVRVLLSYLDFEMSEIQEVIEFIEELPLKYLVSIEEICKLYFDQDTEIKKDLLEMPSAKIPTGHIGWHRAVAVRNYQVDELNKRLTSFLEQLGVYVKAPPKSSGESKGVRTTGWIPLTQAMNPEGFDKVRKSLTPEEWFEEGSEDQLPTQEDEKKLAIEMGERVGKIPLSAVATREEYVRYILEHANVGFLEKANTMNSREYHESVLYPTNRGPSRDEVQKTSAEAEKREVSIRSRWKGQKSERKLEDEKK